MTDHQSRLVRHYNLNPAEVVQRATEHQTAMAEHCGFEMSIEEATDSVLDAMIEASQG